MVINDVFSGMGISTESWRIFDVTWTCRWWWMMYTDTDGFFMDVGDEMNCLSATATVLEHWTSPPSLMMMNKYLLDSLLQCIKSSIKCSMIFGFSVIHIHIQYIEKIYSCYILFCKCFAIHGNMVYVVWIELLGFGGFPCTFAYLLRASYPI